MSLHFSRHVHIAYTAPYLRNQPAPQNDQFHQTTHLLEALEVRDVAFVESHRDTVLMRVLSSELATVNCVPMARRAFNEEEGTDRLHQLACGQLVSTHAGSDTRHLVANPSALCVRAPSASHIGMR
jgi:hypothetical protein